MSQKTHNIIILNGPNLNLLGEREVNIYGHITFEKYFSQLQLDYNSLNLAFEQHNSEGELIDAIQEYGLNGWSIIINPGAYTHTSIGIRDALLTVQSNCIEVHISDISAREKFRKSSMIQDIVDKTIVGKGLAGYAEAIDWLSRYSINK